MKKEEIDALVAIRVELIKDYIRCKDYKQNKNAIMREVDHIAVLERTIKSLDKVLSSHVNFS